MSTPASSPRRHRPQEPLAATNAVVPAPAPWFSAAVWGVFLVALGLRMLHVWQLRHTPYFDVLLGDAKGYDEWARRIASGDWIGSDVFYQAPLYPYLLGVVYRVLGHSLLAVRLAQAVLGATACVLLALATRRFFGAVVGVVAGAALATYAPAIFFDGLIQKSALDTVCLTWSLWLMGGLLAPDAVVDPALRRRWLALGIALGALSLTRENALVFVAVVAGWMALRSARGARWTARIPAAGAFAVGLALVLMPVAARNAAVGGGFYLTTSQFGPNFYIGNNPNADGTYMSLRFGRGAPEYERQDATTLAEHATGRTLTPGEVSSYWTDRALDFIVGQPGRWLTLMARKGLLLVNAREMLDTESQESYAEWSTPLRWLGWWGHFGVLVPLALLGLILSWPARARLVVWYVMTGSYAASVLLFYVFARYRLPLVPLLLPFAAQALVWVWSAARTGVPQGRWPLWAFGIAALCALPANWPLLAGTLMQAITETNLGTELTAQGRTDEAVSHYRRAIALQPDYAPAYNNLGVTLRAQGKVEDAIATYRTALATHADYPDAHYNLANALLAQGAAAEAAEHFEIALRSIPDEAGVRNNLGIALAAQGKPEAAVAALRAAVTADPSSAVAHRNLGDVLVASGHADEGLAELRRATALDPRDVSAHYNLGVALLEAEQLEEAVAAFRAALALRPQSEDALNNLGIALGGLGRYAEAEASFRAALSVNPRSDDAAKNLAVLQGLLRQSGRPASRMLSTP